MQVRRGLCVAHCAVRRGDFWCSVFRVRLSALNIPLCTPGSDGTPPPHLSRTLCVSSLFDTVCSHALCIGGHGRCVAERGGFPGMGHRP